MCAFLGLHACAFVYVGVHVCVCVYVCLSARACACVCCFCMRLIETIGMSIQDCNSWKNIVNDCEIQNKFKRKKGYFKLHFCLFCDYYLCTEYNCALILKSFESLHKQQHKFQICQGTSLVKFNFLGKQCIITATILELLCFCDNSFFENFAIVVRIRQITIE